MGVNATMKPSTRTWHVARLAFGRVGRLRDAQLPAGAGRVTWPTGGSLAPMSRELDLSHVAGDIVATYWLFEIDVSTRRGFAAADLR